MLEICPQLPGADKRLLKGMHVQDEELFEEVYTPLQTDLPQQECSLQLPGNETCTLQVRPSVCCPAYNCLVC